MAEPTIPAVITIVKTRTLLEKEGWVRGSWKTYEGRCLLQGLKDVNGPGEGEATRIIRNLVGQEITRWNDVSTRRWEDVLEVLNAAQHIATELSE